MTAPAGLPRHPLPTAAVAAVAVVAFGGLAGCGSAAAGGAGPAGGPAAELRLGFLANLTHATPLVGTGQGFYERELGQTRLRTQVFNAGPGAVEAILSGSLDAAYLGPSPAINAYVRSKGETIRVVAGATAGGAALVVRPDITGVKDLRGTRLASPQLGSTQDVALRAWLADHGLSTSITGDGDAAVVPTENATALELYRQGEIDGGWLPEPWASWLVGAGAQVLVDEREWWPGGRFPTTNLVVSTAFLGRHPETVEALLRGHVAAGAWINAHRGAAGDLVNARLADLIGKPLPSAVLDRAWPAIEVTDDPLAETLSVTARRAHEAGLLPEADVSGLYDPRPLQSVRKAGARRAMAGSTSSTSGGMQP